MRRANSLALAFFTVAAVLGALAGCSGQYNLAATDVVAPAGGKAPATIHLERQEFWFWYVPAKELAITFKCEDRGIRAAYTNDGGYAAALMLVPEKPGKYTYRIATMDREGDEVNRNAGCYVFKPDVLAVAVSWAALTADPKGSVDALGKLADAGVQIIYLNRAPEEMEQLHGWLEQRDYPDGAVIGWYWNHKTSQVTGALPGVRQQMPNVILGVAKDEDDALAFSRLGMATASVGATKKGMQTVSWAQLAERIVADKALMQAQDFANVSGAQVAEQLGLGVAAGGVPMAQTPMPETAAAETLPAATEPATESASEPAVTQPTVKEPSSMEELAPELPSSAPAVPAVPPSAMTQDAAEEPPATQPAETQPVETQPQAPTDETPETQPADTQRSE